MTSRQNFERVRDTYFINPDQPDVESLTDASAIILDGFANRGEPGQPLDEAVSPAQAIGYDLAADYKGARRFDNLSVAQLHPTDNVPAILANFASTLYNNNTIIGEVSPLETDYENQAMQWLFENIAEYDPAHASGSLVSGGTSANHTAMLVAREALQEQGWDGVTPVKLFASSMTHYSISKAARMLAPRGIIQVDQVPLTPEYTMDVDALHEKVKQARADRQLILGIVAVAGETETGLVDDLSTVAQIAGENDVYFHVDGAYGAPFILSRARARFEAVKESRSLTCDPHKYLYTPYSSGSIMFRDGADHALLEALNSEGEGYMFKGDAAKLAARERFVHNTTYLGQKRIEGSMGGQAASALHATIKHIGREGLASLLDHNLDMTEEFADEVLRVAPELKLSFEPQLNTVCIEPAEAHSGNDARMEKISAELEDKGIYLATTSLPTPDGGRRKVLRFVATHPHTDSGDVQYIAESVSRAWEETK